MRFYFCGRNAWRSERTRSLVPRLRGSYHLMAAPHMQTEETTLNDEAKKQVCATTAYSSFVWRPSQLRKYRDCRRGREPGLSNRIQHCWSRLRQLRIRFVGNLYSSRLFRAQRTISFTRRIDSLVPKLSPRLFYFSSSMYARMTSSIFRLRIFFRSFYFREGSVRANLLCTAKISH